jgi:hypothetical protein
MSNSPAKIQTLGQASSSISSTFKSTFSSLANTLGLPELRDSFFQNIIYILLTIIIFVGILVYIQMVGLTGNDPLNSPPSRVIKKVEIKKIVEGFDITDNSAQGVATHAETMGENDENNYSHHDIHLADSGEHGEHNDKNHDKYSNRRKKY